MKTKRKINVLKIIGKQVVELKQVMPSPPCSR